MLAGYGEVDEAEGGVEAVLLFRKAAAEKTPYHLITLDVNMPTMDGTVTLECIRGLEAVHRSLPKAKVLMVAAVSDPEMIKGMIRLGTEGYLLKPIDRMLLEARVRELFNMPLTADQKGRLTYRSKRPETAVRK